MILQSLLHLNQIRKNLRKPPGELEELQNNKLKSIIKHVYENVPFYHRKFDAAGIKPSDVKTTSDLIKVPVTTKAELRAAPFEDVLNIGVNVSEFVKRYTSGSTGIPLNIFLDRRALNFEGLVLKRTFFENGLKIRDKMAVINDPRENPEEAQGWLQRIGFMTKKQIPVLDDTEKQLAALEQYDPDVLRGYSSALTALAHRCERKATCLHPRLIFAGAEILNDAERRLIRGVFDAELFDFYGSMEFGHMAWECEEHKGYHINVDSMVMEFVEQGEQVDSGERGEILGTNLYNYAMPFIRYKLDDIGSPREDLCSCGRTFPLMKIVEGRKDDFLLALDGKVVSPMIFFPYPFEDFTHVRQLRVIQERRDVLRIQVAVDSSFDKAKSFSMAEKKIQDLFGQGMRLEFDVLDEIAREPSGKLRMVVSKIPNDGQSETD